MTHTRESDDRRTGGDERLVDDERATSDGSSRTIGDGRVTDGAACGDAARETDERHGGRRAAEGDAPFRPRVALASLSGAADAAWARRNAANAGAAFLGGIALDEPTRAAARALVARDRSEFLPTDPIAWIDEQAAALADAPIRAGVNVRAASPEPVGRAAAAAAAHDAWLEVNAHCRQSEMCEAGAGESLLRAPDRLAAQVTAAAATDAQVSVKLRAEVAGVDLPRVARRAVAAGADAVHVDAMDSEGEVARVARAVPEATVIANNAVRDRRTVREYLACGADAVSLGRPSDAGPVRRRVAAAVSEWFRDDAGTADARTTDAEAADAGRAAVGGTSDESVGEWGAGDGSVGEARTGDTRSDESRDGGNAHVRDGGEWS